MKRYGNNLPSSSLDEIEEQEQGGTVRVMYGGCGVRYGTFTIPTEIHNKQKNSNILSFLTSVWKKAAKKAVNS